MRSNYTALIKKLIWTWITVLLCIIQISSTSAKAFPLLLVTPQVIGIEHSPLGLL